MADHDTEQPGDDSLQQLAAASDNPLRRVVVKPVLPTRTRVILILMQVWAAVLYLGSTLLLVIALMSYAVQGYPLKFERFENGFHLSGWAVPLGLAVFVFVVAKLQSRVIHRVRTTVEKRLAAE